MATPLSDERPPLALVKNPPQPPVEDAVIVHRPDTGRPAWIESARTLAERTARVANSARLPHTMRGYRKLGRRWLDKHRDHYPQLIASADAAIRDAAGDVAQEARVKALRDQYREEYRRHRLIHSAKTAGWTSAAGVGGAFGVVTGSLWIDLLAALVAYGYGAYHGTDRTPTDEGQPIPGLPAAETTASGAVTVDQLPEGAEPFPLARAETPEQAATCVLLAARAENLPIIEVSDMARQPWGWQCTVRVSEGTPEAIIDKAGGLETRFDLPTNGVRPQPLKARRACAVLRLVDGDPFATAPGLPYRAPKSLSITDAFRVGTSVGGDPLELSLAGVMGLIVAASGGGKTGILQALAEGVTACRDNITIDLDPFGDGLEDLGDAVRITARSNEQIEAVLLFFLVMAKGRARLRAKLGMGKKWRPTPEHPAVTIFFDELPKASTLAKRLYNDLLLVGRKELITVLAASQGGQAAYLGANIAQMVALKAVGPCKVEDARSVFGDGSVREGYLPHKLSPATQTDPKDAGHIFIQGVPGKADEPIEYAIHETQPDILRKVAQERLEAGLLDPDQDSLDAMSGVDLPEYCEPEYDKEGDIKKPAPVRLLTWEQLLRLCDAQPAAGRELADGPERAAVEDAVAVMEKAGVDRMKTETLLAALRDFDADAYGDLDVADFKALMKKAGAGSPVTLGQIGDELNPRGFKRDRLRNLL
jgi:S-DNA-T family DNA segregation ATPase FtsK/SpoIIIE